MRSRRLEALAPDSTSPPPSILSHYWIEGGILLWGEWMGFTWGRSGVRREAEGGVLCVRACVGAGGMRIPWQVTSSCVLTCRLRRPSERFRAIAGGRRVALVDTTAYNLIPIPQQNFGRGCAGYAAPSPPPRRPHAAPTPLPRPHAAARRPDAAAAQHCHSVPPPRRVWGK